MEEQDPVEEKTEEEQTEEEQPIRGGIKGLLDRWRIFSKKVPRIAKAIIAILIFITICGIGLTAFTTYNITQNDPNFCNKCHIMNDSFAAWQTSVHKDINCHECHHLSISELNALMVSAIILRTNKVPVRYGKIIVPWKYCMGCHWEENEKYPEAVKINNSRLHSKHYFMEQIECSKCHGYKVHEFKPEEKYCLECHKSKVVHGKGMGGLACLNCHTDRTADLRPGPNKCLFCHGGNYVREMLLLDETLDVTNFTPSKETIDKATKIDRPKDAPMQFFCYECHKPHDKVRPDYGTCLSCHPKIVEVGKHKIHVQSAGIECVECHVQHSWRVDKEKAKTLCADCHDYEDPDTFLGNEGSEQDS